MKDYSHFDVEKLVGDPYFRESILTPDEHSRRFWINWKKLSRANNDLYDQAATVLLAVQEGYADHLADETIDIKVHAMMERLPKAPHQTSVLWLHNWWWNAAAAILVLGVGWWLLAGKDVIRLSRNEKALTNAMAHAITKVNTTALDQTVVLSDSSVVTLAAGASIRFPADFNNKSRVVTLSGKAFFEVSHDRQKPFLVYAGETVTKVLGTSFLITAMASGQVVKVWVKTGKVSVFRVNDFDSNTLAVVKNGVNVILTPNEQVVYDHQNQTLLKEMSAPTQFKTKETVVSELIFDDTPVSEVFRRLEQLYGMDIEFNEKAFASCPITTSFREEGLIERINTICQAVGATYKPIEGKIIVSGSGCQY
jgi:transmembrane sensor